MCKRAGLLVGWDDVSKRALVARANCDSWNCEECSRRMSENWILRAEIGARELINNGARVDFVTITSHEKLKSFAATETIWRSAWRTLYAALKRQNVNMQYMIIPEKHEDGRMHVHALWSAGVSKRWLKDNGRKRGLGYMADVDQVKSPRAAVKYVTKYIGKSLGEDVPKRFRRVRVSQGWAEVPKPETVYNALRWEYVGSNGALITVYEECAAKHISLIDIETGEIFDDVDLGTITAT
jgi:hypothetical protein